MVALGLLAPSRIAGPRIVDLLGANPAQRNERRDAERGRTEEYRALGKILAGQSHHAGCQRVAGCIKPIVAPSPN